jgi:hypothetical protein
MGATGWKYFVPYQADISAALQQLQERVFAEGHYSSGIAVSKTDYGAALRIVGSNRRSDLEHFASQAADPKLPQQVRNKFAVLAQQLKQLSDSNAPLPKPRTIEELLERQGESGTHSILDIVRVCHAPEFGAVHPMPASKAIEIFGTEKPSRAQIESKHEECALEEYVRERWQGIYIVAYRNGLPDEIFFAGCSGD